MKLARSLVAAFAATSLIGAPVLAAPVNAERTSTAADGENVRGNNLLLPFAALIAAILAVILLTDGGDQPVSP